MQAETSNNNEQGDKYEGVFARCKKDSHLVGECHNLLGDDLEVIGDGSKGISYDSQPHGDAKAGGLEDLAIRRARISSKVDLIERVCRDVDPELYPWLIKGFTSDEVGYDYLRYRLGMPCGRNQYYEKRRKFYFLLYREKQKKWK